jgi:hypothetical protein
MASINALFTPRRALFDLVLTRYLGEKRARRLASDAPEVASARTSQDLHFSNSSLGESINHSCIKTCTFRISRKVTGWDSADDQTTNRSQREALRAPPVNFVSVDLGRLRHDISLEKSAKRHKSLLHIPQDHKKPMRN